jgi:hypothetical protein
MHLAVMAPPAVLLEYPPLVAGVVDTIMPTLVEVVAVVAVVVAVKPIPLHQFLQVGHLLLLRGLLVGSVMADLVVFTGAVAVVVAQHQLVITAQLESLVATVAQVS